MATFKKLGIWMDHSSSHIMEFIENPVGVKNLELKTPYQTKEHGIGHNENAMHNKEQGQQTDFYKKLAEVIKNYDEVVLFGPSNAKSELMNILKEDHLFSKIKIIVKPADNMTENQQHAFVKDHFSNN